MEKSLQALHTCPLFEGICDQELEQLLPCLHGDISLAQAAEAIKVGTRNYARRQLIWFRRDTRIRWIPSTELSHAKERIIQDWEEHIR